MKAILSLMWKVFHGWNVFESRTGWEILLPCYYLGKDESKGSDMVTLSTGIMSLRVPGIKYIWMHSWEWQNWKSDPAQTKQHGLWSGYRDLDNWSLWSSLVTLLADKQKNKRNFFTLQFVLRWT